MSENGGKGKKVEILSQELTMLLGGKKNQKIKTSRRKHLFAH